MIFKHNELDYSQAKITGEVLEPSFVDHLLVLRNENFIPLIIPLNYFNAWNMSHDIFTKSGIDFGLALLLGSMAAAIVPFYFYTYLEYYEYKLKQINRSWNPPWSSNITN